MTRHQVETELSDIRREITRLQRREAALLNGTTETLHPRPGWPMQRDFVPQTSTSAPSRTAV